MRQRVFVSVLIASLALSSAVFAQSGERAAGRRIATELCGDCHQVRPPFPNFYRHPPTFEEIAKLPSTTGLSLKVFLQSNHTTMRTPTETIAVTPGAFVVHPPGEVHEYENGSARTMLFRVRYGSDMRAHHCDWRGNKDWKQSAEDAAYYRRHPVTSHL